MATGGGLVGNLQLYDKPGHAGEAGPHSPLDVGPDIWRLQARTMLLPSTAAIPASLNTIQVVVGIPTVNQVIKRLDLLRQHALPLEFGSIMVSLAAL